MKRYNIIYLFAFLFALLAGNEAWAQETRWSAGEKAGIALSGTLILDGNVTLSSGSIRPADNSTLVIDLNGHNITRKSGVVGQMLLVNLNTALIVKDSKGGGAIQGGRADRGGCIFIGNGGTFELQSGTIRDCKTTNNNSHKDEGSPSVNHATKYCGGAVYMNEGSTFIMSGGVIENCSTYYVASTHSYISTDDEKAYVLRGRGGAVFIDADESGSSKTTFSFRGGIIRNCQSGSGGAVYVHVPITKKTGATTLFEMYDGAVIENCNALLSEDYIDGGGGVMVASSDYGRGTFNMYGGTITGCETAGYGCGVMACGDMNMSGGLITKCKPSTWPNDLVWPNTHAGGIYGGGVFTVDNGVFTMTGGTISGNKAASGGGVMVWGYEIKDGNNKVIGKVSSTFIMNGSNAVIEDNMALGQGGLGNGGAVYVQHGTFKFENGTLQKNKAVRYGGAININQSSILNLNGNCQVYDNEASHGGGLSQEAGECHMALNNSGIEIKNNKASGSDGVPGNGGGLFIEKGILEIEAGTIADNSATGYGGGASLRVERIVGDARVIIDGGTISNNTAQKGGGGIDLYANPGAAGSEDDNGKNDIIVDFNKGVMSGNQSYDGGGIHININTANSTATMNIGTSNTVPEISGNIASNNGGAFALNSGVINIVNGTLTENKAGLSNGKGGAIYLGGGEFHVTEKATVSYNEAFNGGAICVENGTVTIKEGQITDNISHNYGGGLYVNNTMAAEKKITFSGGNFTNNNAKLGGGVFAEGNLTLQIDATLDANTATNGGGIYLNNGVKLKFGEGLIRSNKAIAANGSTFETAYGKDNIHGVGGGIFLNNNTSIEFLDATQFGLYNNRADNAADDIFATGEGTTVGLPSVNDMKLKGFDVPTDKLYWVEDYVTGDTEYSKGTNQMAVSGTGATEIFRYQYALRNMKPMVQLPDDNLDVFKNKYICLCLGYELVYVTLNKKGLDAGDIITFLISYKDKNTGKLELYRKIYVLGTSSEIDKKNIVLPTGKWLFKESDWGWKYETNPQYMNNAGVDPRDLEGFIEITAEANKVITVINTKKEEEDTNVPDWVDIREAEHIKVNIMGRKEEQ